jgi:hypothetical protein
MTAANILLYVALIGYVLYRKMQGQPLKQGKHLFVLPVLMIVIGYGDLTHGHMKSIAIAITVIGAVVSLTLGALRGSADRLSIRDGVPFVQWTRVSLGLFAANILAKLVIDLIGIAAGSTTSAVGKSLIFTLGLTLLGEALVLLVRSGGAAGLLDQVQQRSAHN